MPKVTCTGECGFKAVYKVPANAVRSLRYGRGNRGWDADKNEIQCRECSVDGELEVWMDNEEY